MQAADTDLAFGRLAVERRLVSEDQVRQCLQIKQQLNRPTSLGAVLVHRGLLTQQQAQELEHALGGNGNGNGHGNGNGGNGNGGPVGSEDPTIRGHVSGGFAGPASAASGSQASGSVIAVTCSACGSRFGARPEHMGHVMPCPRCKASIPVPGGPGGSGTSSGVQSRPGTNPWAPGGSGAFRSGAYAGGAYGSGAFASNPHARLLDAPSAPPPPPPPLPGSRPMMPPPPPPISHAGSGSRYPHSGSRGGIHRREPLANGGGATVPADHETLMVSGPTLPPPQTERIAGMPPSGAPGSAPFMTPMPPSGGRGFSQTEVGAPPGVAPQPGDPGFEPLFSGDDAGAAPGVPGALELDEASVAEVADPIARVFGRRVGPEGEVTTFGPYDVLGEIARGGMGIVYKARQRDLKRLVALKILKEGEEATERQVRRFKRETAAAAKLQHPNIVAVHEVGCHAGFHYFTMDLIEGEPLDQIVKRARPSKEKKPDGRAVRPGGLDTDWSLKVLEEISRAIHYAHGKKVIHRDLKPANILMDREGHPKITDFGLAKDLDQKSLLTRTGAAVGTPFYMAPEQARGDEKIDHRIDVYALGVILYEALTGTPPFVGNSTMEIYHKILEEEPVPPRQHNAKIPRDAETICMKAIDKEPRKRYQSAEELADDIKRFIEGEPIHARPVGPIERLIKKARKNLAVVATVAVAVAVLVPSVIAIAYRHYQEVQQQIAQKRQLELDRFKEAVKERHLAVESILTTAGAKLRDNNPDEALEEIDAAVATLDGIQQLVEDRAPAEDDDDATITREDLLAHLREVGADTRRHYREAHVLAAESQQKIGTKDSLQLALGCYDRALEHESDYSPARHGIAQVHVALGDLDQALATLRKVLDGDPNDHDARLLLGRYLRRDGRFEEAVRELETVVARAIDPLAGRVELGLLLLAMGEAERAHDEFEAVLDQQDDSFEGYLGRGRANEAMGWTQEALDDFNEAVDLQPSRPEGYYFRARHHLAQGKHGDALKDFEIATARDERFYPAWLGLGAVQVWQLEWDRAAESFVRITEANDRASQDFAAEAWMRLGDLHRLQADVGSVLQKKVDEREAKARRSLLQMAGRMRVAQESGQEQEMLGQIGKALEGEANDRDSDLADAEKAVGRLTDEALAAYDKARALDELLVEAPLGRAEFLIRRDRFDEAKAALDDAEATLIHRQDAATGGELRPSPLPGGALPATLPIEARIAFARAQLALEQGKPDEAIDVAKSGMDRLPETDPEHDVRFLLRAVVGLAEMKKGDADAAHETLAAAAAAAREGEHSIAKLLDLANKSKDSAIRSKKLEYYSRARAYFTRVIDLFPYDADAYLGRARLEVAWKYNDFAEEDFTAAIASSPFMREAWVERGLVRVRGSDEAVLKTAVDDFTRALQIDKGEQKGEALDALLAQAHVGRARALRKLGQQPEALTDARASSVLAPRVEEAFSILESIHEARGEPTLALAAMMERKAIRAVSRAEAENHYQKGQQFQNRRSYPEAIAEFDEAIKLDPDLSQAYYERGTCYIKIGNFVPGILDLSKALELDPDIANILYEKVYQVSYVVDLNRVIGELNKIVGDHPDESHVVFLRGFFYVAKTELKKYEPEDIDKGIADLDRTLEINPRHLPAYVYRGMLYFKKGDVATALKDYDRALTYYEDFGMAHYLKSQALASEERLDEAFHHLERAFANGFNGYERVKQDDTFAPLRSDPRYRRIIGGR